MDLKQYGPYAVGAAALVGGYWWLKSRKEMPAKSAVGAGLDLLGEDEIIFVGHRGGGHGGGGRGHGGRGHGGHGHHGHGGSRGLRGGGWGWGGGPYWWGPAYADGIEVEDLDGPTTEEIAAELAKHLKGQAS